MTTYDLHTLYDYILGNYGVEIDIDAMKNDLDWEDFETDDFDIIKETAIELMEH